MTWYTANMLIVMKPKDYTRGPFKIKDKLYLIEASTQQELLQKIDHIKETIEVITDDGLVHRCIGCRQIISVLNLADDVDQSSPVDGTELTYNFYVINKKDVKDLLEKKAVEISLKIG